MNFIEGRCQILPENLNFIVGLISTLNSCSRRAFSKSIRANITTKEVFGFFGKASHAEV